MKLLATFSVLLSLITALPSAFASPVSSLALPYAKTKVLRVPTGPSEEALKELVDVAESLDLSAWTSVPRVNAHYDVEVPATKYAKFMSAVDKILEKSGAKALGYSVGVMHEDLGASIIAEQEGMYEPVVDARVGLAVPAWFNAYHPYADHLTFLNDLQRTFPSNSRIVTTGTSVGGRAITGINIFGTGGSGSRPAIIWHGTVHAREWISSMTVEYLAYELLNNYANSTEVKGIVDKYDFYIFPVVNPDGFVFSQTTTRLWRKNRQTPPSGSTCYGRDINRNWNVRWSQTGGASTSPCSETYKGLSAADAPETQGLQAFLNARASSSVGAKMFVDWHSYSQLFMSPYGYTCSATAPDNSELVSLSNTFATALRAPYGTRYTTGPICSTIYMTTGSSTDYAYDVSKIKYSFAAELRDTGANGFVLPASQIRPSGIETWAGVRALLVKLV